MKMIIIINALSMTFNCSAVIDPWLRNMSLLRPGPHAVSMVLPMVLNLAKAL